MKINITFSKVLSPSFVVMLLLPLSCNRFLDVDPPTDQLAQINVFKDKSTALAALTDVYAGLRDNSVLDGSISGAHFLTSIYTDDLSTVTTDLTGFGSFHKLTVQSSAFYVDNLWMSAYKNIYAANNIMEGVANSGSYLDEATSKSITGEALAIRALLHLYLTELFGEVPYVESTDFRVNQNISKNTRPEIFTKMLRDLHQAENLLVDAPSVPGNTRFSIAAVRLLLARVYLYEEKYSEAKTFADLVIQDPQYQLEQDLGKVFLKESTGTLWQFAPVQQGANTVEGQTYIILDTPPPNAFLTENLVSSFEPSDMRKERWIKNIGDGTVLFAFPFKYHEFSQTSASVEYSVMLRIEEAYLIAAEAENSVGNTGGALQRLYSIRTRAGLSTPADASQQEIQDMIISERRHEFFTEGAHRFFDLKRWGMLDTVMSSLKPNWMHFMEKWPLPQRELLVNPKLNPQNDGY